MQPFRIVTYNIAHGRGLSLYQGFSRPSKIRRNLVRIAHLLEGLKPDVVALQEVDEDSHWNGHVNLLEFLRVHAHFPYAVLGVNNRRGGPRPLNYGNALLSRHPIVSWENLPFGRATLGEKGFLFAEVDVGGRRLVPVVNLHLDYRSRLNRLRQVERVTDFIGRKYRLRNADWLVPPIVCGDLNNPSHRADATASLRTYFARHGDYALHPPRARTFPSPWPRRALDFVFLPPACRQPRSEVVRSMLSDHCPVKVEFQLPGVREH